MRSHKEDPAERLREFIRRAQEELESLEEKSGDVLEEVKERKESIENFVKDNPLLALGGALILGYAIGHLFKRGRR